MTFSALLSLEFVHGQTTSPSLRCIAVDSVGDVALTWISPTDTCTYFTNYYIYNSSNSTGPFTLLDSVSGFNVNTYLHLGANADINSVFYYVFSNSGCASTISDTLESIYLTLSPNSLGEVNLNWNQMHNPSLASTSSFTFINKENTIGLMLLIDSVQNTSAYIDSFTTCTDTISYQVLIPDNSGCISTSSYAFLEPDGLQPSIVTIDSVSIDPLTGDAQIGWSSSLSSDVAGYIVYVENNFGGWDSIGFTIGNNNTFYLDAVSMADTVSVVYNIAAFDLCGNKSIFGPSHNSIFLEGTLDTCLGEALLTWNDYSNWPSGISDYELYVSVNSGTYTLLSSTINTTYTHTGLSKTESYCYYVRAVNGLGTKTASSNSMCSFSDTISGSAVALSLFAEARDSVKNVLIWNEDTSWNNIVGSYSVFRSTDGSGFQSIASCSFGTNSFTDSLEPLSFYQSGEGRFCYYIVPIKTGLNYFGCIDTSSLECVNQYPKFVMPNAFTPNGDGLNDIFKPSKVFVDNSNYLLSIYNRWGQLLFESTDSSIGWDGRFKDFYVPEGVYVFNVRFYIQGGTKVVKAGTLILLH